MITFSSNIIHSLSNNKNLLAFSAGVDSTALFFLLQESNIDFDIAIINHNLRKSSIDEVNYAKELCEKYNKKIYIKEVSFNTKSNLEYKARNIRYDFFDKVVAKNDYTNLITAHQLDDMLEWFLMQLSKGAGLKELLGMQEISTREIKDKDFLVQKQYKILKPLLQYSKDIMLKYLEKNNIKYFIDESNIDVKFKRNYIRKTYSNQFLKEFENGIKKSFEFLQNDIDLLPKIILIKQNKKYYIYKNETNNTQRILDFAFKKIGILLSLAQKNEIMQTKDCVISSKISVFIDDDFIHIAPYIKHTIPKKIRETYRIKKIPIKIRGYLYKKLLLD